MKQEIVTAFEEVTMPVDCEKRIRTAMAEKKPRSTLRILRTLGTAAAALAMVLTVTLCLSPEARAAVNRVIRYIFPESGIMVYEEMDNDGNVASIVVVDTEAPPFAEVRGDRLYFTGDGQDLDITDQITEKDPFYYSYTDDYGLTHYMVVGYSGNIENYGIYEFMRENREGQRDWEGWSTGTGRNFQDPETGTRYPWVDIVWEELNLPWPKPGE